MDISLLVKQQILHICGGPAHVPEKLPDYVPLSHLGYDEDIFLCRELEHELRQLVTDCGLSRQIDSGEISQHMTVSQCIELVA